jgi:hypothetical protein
VLSSAATAAVAQGLSGRLRGEKLIKARQLRGDNLHQPLTIRISAIIPKSTIEFTRGFFKQHAP